MINTSDIIILHTHKHATWLFCLPPVSFRHNCWLNIESKCHPQTIQFPGTSPRTLKLTTHANHTGLQRCTPGSDINTYIFTTLNKELKHGDTSHHWVAEVSRSKERVIYRSSRYFPMRCTTHSCWHRGQRLFCLTHSDMQQLWNEWLQSPHTTAITHTDYNTKYLHSESAWEQRIVRYKSDHHQFNAQSTVQGIKEPVFLRVIFKAILISIYLYIYIKEYCTTSKILKKQNIKFWQCLQSPQTTATVHTAHITGCFILMLSQPGSLYNNI